MPELLIDAQAQLGECVVWCDQAAALYWTDIEGATLWRHSPATGQTRHWPLPDRCGSFALCTDSSQLLLGLAAGIALFDLDRNALTPVITVEASQPSTRINDGRCDAQGRFVFGMFNASGAAIGGFYRVHADLSIERLPLPPAAVANSIAFSPGGERLYFADSPSRIIQCVDYGADGRLGVPRVFTTLRADEGYPDGSVADADGGLWNAQWDGGCVVRYGPDGVATQRVELPVSRPTCPAFGGPQLDQLYLTTARIGLSAQALQAQPQAGGLFAITPGRRGLREHRFASALRA